MWRQRTARNGEWELPKQPRRNTAFRRPEVLERNEPSPAQEEKNATAHVTSCPQPPIRDGTRCSGKFHQTQYVPRTVCPEYMFQSGKGWCRKPYGERARWWNQKNEFRSHHHVIRYVRSISRLQFSLKWKWSSRNTWMVVPSPMVCNSPCPSRWDVYSPMPFALWLPAPQGRQGTFPAPVSGFATWLAVADVMCRNLKCTYVVHSVHTVFQPSARKTTWLRGGCSPSLGS